MPHRIWIHQPTKRLQVTGGEGIEGPADELLVGMGHDSPLSPDGGGSLRLGLLWPQGSTECPWPLACEHKHGRGMTGGDAWIVALTLAFGVVACRLLLAGCRAFAAYQDQVWLVRNVLGTIVVDDLGRNRSPGWSSHGGHNGRAFGQWCGAGTKA
jgi:hypothetical protein